MEGNLAEQIQKRLAELPADVRDAIQSADLEKRVQEIAAKQQLHIDQMGELEDEVFLVMLGFSNPDTFGVRLAQELHLAPEKGQAVATDVSNQIFLPIRESMKKFAQLQRAGTAPAKSVIMPSAQAAADTKPVSVPTPPPALLPLKLPTAPAGQSPLGGAPKIPAPPPLKPEMHSAEMMLREKTVSVPVPAIPPPPFVPKPPVPLATPVAPTKPVPPKPTNYKADPYREPIEP